MANVTLTVDDGSVALECRALAGEENLCEVARFDLQLVSAMSVEIRSRGKGTGGAGVRGLGATVQVDARRFMWSGP